jgi:hypothetical protein
MTYPTQRVTDVDIRAGRIRVPHDTKVIFPADRSRVAIVLRGTPFDVAYDPRMGPDKERSGVLHVGSALADFVTPDDVLNCAQRGDSITID